MKLRRFQYIAIVLIVGLHFASGQEFKSERNDARAASERNREALLRHLRPVLESTGAAGRLYYGGECWTKLGDGISFPQLELEPPSKEAIGLAAVRHIFSKSKEAMITEGRSGVIGIRIGDVSDDLLKTKIDMLTLKPIERYNFQRAIMAIQRAREIQAKMRKLGMEEPVTILHEHIIDPAPGLPHLPAFMKDMTMDEALDRVARTFGGLVIYGECTSANGTRLLSVNFVPIAQGQARDQSHQ